MYKAIVHTILQEQKKKKKPKSNNREVKQTKF